MGGRSGPGRALGVLVSLTLVVAFAVGAGRGEAEFDPQAVESAAGALVPPEGFIAGVLSAPSLLRDGIGMLEWGSGELHQGMQLASEGSAELHDGISQTADGTREFSDGLRMLADGTIELADGAGQAHAGSQDLTGGLYELADGNRQLAMGLWEAEDGVGQLGSGLGEAVDGVGQLLGGVREIDGVLGVMLEGGELEDPDTGRVEFFPGMAAIVGDASDPEVDQGADDLAEGLCDFAEDPLLDMMGMLGDLDVGGLLPLLGEMPDLPEGLDPAALDEFLGQINMEEFAPLLELLGMELPDGLEPAMIDELFAALGELLPMLGELPDLTVPPELDLSALDDIDAGAVEEQLAEACGGARELVRGLDGITQILEGLRDGVSQDDDENLVDGVAELHDGLRMATAGVWELHEGLGEATDGAGHLASGGFEAAAGSGELAAGLGEVADGTEQISDGMVEAADGSDELADGLVEMADGAGEFTDGLFEISDGAGQLAEGTGQLASMAGPVANNLPLAVVLVAFLIATSVVCAIGWFRAARGLRTVGAGEED